MHANSIATSIVLCCGLTHGYLNAAPPLSTVSPNGLVRIEFSLRKAGEREASPHYRATFDNMEIIGHSRLGVELEGGTALGETCEVEAVEARSVHEEYTQVTGKRRAVTAHATELVVRLRENTIPRRTWEVAFRAYDDGVAFRYLFPKQDGWDKLAIAREEVQGPGQRSRGRFVTRDK